MRRACRQVEQLMRGSYCPMGQIGTARDAAHAAWYLAPGEARCLTGPELVVDGELTP